jgi:signal transduction histidine kinase
VELPPLAERVVETLAPLAWKRGRVEALTDLPADLPPVLADAGRLEQVLINLLRNGVRHTPPGGIVALAAAPEEETLRIEVRDTGSGIPAKELPLIWQRFYRGAAGDRSGAGLGLALVKELVEAMNGRVAVQSTEGEGSIFSIWLPKA